VTWSFPSLRFVVPSSDRRTPCPATGLPWVISGGQILVDSKGITLYDFVADKGKTSVCYGACAALWPPLITHGKPVAGHGVRRSLLGTTKRKDGKLQVTYGGHPLYYFVTDRKPGQTTGQGVNQFGGPWWVLSPKAKEIHRG
jgi:predicted lipoprotein with Yx(FWY)xxD motif